MWLRRPDSCLHYDHLSSLTNTRTANIEHLRTELRCRGLTEMPEIQENTYDYAHLKL